MALLVEATANEVLGGGKMVSVFCLWKNEFLTL